MPKDGLEYEQLVTLRAGRGAAVGQEDFNRWELCHELEYGLTDKYALSLYVNERLENFRDPVVTYRRETWWAALTVMPQVFGVNFEGNPGKSSYQELEGHERWNVRLIFGLNL